MLQEIMEYLPFLIPLLIIQLVLAVTSILHVLRHKNYRFGNRILWIIICALLSIVGPVLYFAIGKGDE